ncbi:uncharacterized protein LOC124311520 [Daphnia pulicaria]|uniref:uncharacterized protein LOC124311520 n=1 Tax=Daphnia pulicaria TaxID=35523 RepID=UPI001EE9C26C|nr:uncharacterized protein LOC124311520 [Daphnia pulicaria]
MHSKIVFLLALWAVVASSMPMNSVDEVVPDQDAEEQFLYSYGYGYPGFAYPSVPLAATYPAAISTDKVPASTAKLITQPAYAYAYPGYYPYAGYPHPGGFGYAYGYPIKA